MNKGWLCAGLAMAVGPGPAHAHSSVPGIDGFYVGLLHPFSTPSQALVILGLGLLAGGFAPFRARWLLGAFLAATLLGLILGSRSLPLEAMMFAIAFLASTSFALRPGNLLPLAIGLVAVGGVLIGTVSVPDPGPIRDRLVTMTGSTIGANIGLLYVFGFVLFVKERYTWDWVGVALRVLSAWLGAISLVMLALQFAVSNTAP
ncbi:HupE/UreJ family protein [Roseibium sp. SCP14]|uniref:HupE/UreJ family protein n=1 Tax=Roseibium sp. SCP14 TaxID=3141375 RepID=UPI003335592B